MCKNVLRILNGLAYGPYGLLGFDSDFTLHNTFLDYEIKNYQDRKDVTQIEKLFPYQALRIKTGSLDANSGSVIERVTVTAVTPKETPDSAHWDYIVFREDGNVDKVSAYSLYAPTQVYERNIAALAMRYNELLKKNHTLNIENEFAKKLFNGITINTGSKE